MSRTTMGPSRAGATVSPHDTNYLAQTTQRLWVTGTGTLTVTMADGNDLNMGTVPSNTMFEIAVIRVKSTGTSATGIIAFY